MPKPMTETEARVGINQRVRDMETGQVGRLVAVHPVEGKSGTYFVGVVIFENGTQRIWLKCLEWVDGPPPTPTSLPVAHDAVLNAAASLSAHGNAEPLFKLLFGRPPTRDEAKHMRGKLGGKCKKCGFNRWVEFTPNGVATVTCLCPPAAAPVPADEPAPAEAAVE